MSTKNNIPEVHNTVRVSAVEERTSDKKNIKKSPNSSKTDMGWYWRIVITMILGFLAVLGWYVTKNAFSYQARSLTIQRTEASQNDTSAQLPSMSFNRSKGAIHNPNSNTVIVNPQRVTPDSSDDIELFKLIYDLFNSHFVQLLTVLGILMTIFGVVIPLATYIFQRKTLTEEREALMREFHHELEQKIMTVTNAITNGTEEKIQEVNKSTADFAKTFSARQEELSSYRSDLERRFQENIDRANDTHEKLVSLRDEISEMRVSVQNSLDEKINQLILKINTHETSLEESRNYQFFTFGYFAEQLGAAMFLSNASSSFIYYLIAAERFAFVPSEGFRSKQCLQQALNALNNPAFSAVFLDPLSIGTNLNSIRQNKQNDIETINLVNQIESILRSKGVAVGYPS